MNYESVGLLINVSATGSRAVVEQLLKQLTPWKAITLAGLGLSLGLALVDSSPGSVKGFIGSCSWLAAVRIIRAPREQWRV